MNTLEFLRVEARNAFSTPDLSSSVYKTTTYEKPKSDRRHELFTFPWIHGNASKEIIEDDDELHLRHFHNLPPRTPVDLQFKDISYYVKTGFRKSE